VLVRVGPTFANGDIQNASKRDYVMLSGRYRPFYRPTKSVLPHHSGVDGADTRLETHLPTTTSTSQKTDAEGSKSPRVTPFVREDGCCRVKMVSAAPSGYSPLPKGPIVRSLDQLGLIHIYLWARDTLVRCRNIGRTLAAGGRSRPGDIMLSKTEAPTPFALYDVPPLGCSEGGMLHMNTQS